MALPGFGIYHQLFASLVQLVTDEGDERGCSGYFCDHNHYHGWVEK
jgi:hypothetical protein